MRHHVTLLGGLRNNALPAVVASTSSSFLPTSSQQLPLSAAAATTSTRSFSSASAEYYQKKKDLKELRTTRFAERTAHKDQVKRRRDGKNRNTRTKKFNAWFMAKKRMEEITNSRAKKLGLDWKVQVAVVLERLPVVLPDKADWERDYDNLRSYLDQFGRDYPESLMGKMEIEEMENLSDEAILEKYLPRGYTPAPRETEADASGEVKTLDRRLKTWVYLTVKDTTIDGDAEQWQLPSVSLKDEESLLDASKRAIAEKVGSGMEIYYPSGCPMAVDLKIFTKEERAKHENTFGVKTFFMVVQYDEGKVSADDITVDDFAWLEKSEVVDRVKEERGEEQSMLYQYLLKEQ